MTMSSLFSSMLIDNLNMFLDKPIPGRSLQIFGVACIVHLAWDHLRIFFRRRAVATQIERNNEAIEATVRKLQEDVRDLSIGTNALLAARADFAQRAVLHGPGFPMTTGQLQDLIKKHALRIGEEVQLLCDSHVEQLNALYSATLEKARDKIGGQELRELVFEEMSRLKKIRQKQATTIQELRDDHGRIMQEEISAMQALLVEQFSGLVDEAIAKSDKVKSVLKLESKHRRLLAKLEIDMVCSTGDDQSITLTCQPEDVFVDLHPLIFVWKISDFRQKLTELMDEDKDIKSMATYVIAPGFSVKAILTCGSEVNRVSIQVESCEERTGDAAALSSFLYYRKFVLMDQNPDSDNDLEVFDRPGFGMNRVEDMILPFFQQTQLCYVEDLSSESNYIKDDQVLIKIIMEPIALVSKRIAFNNGFLVWKIENYMKHKLDAIKERKCWLISEPFRISAVGHYVQAEIALNGVKNGGVVYISTRVKFLLGDHDSLLRRPLKGVCTFYLMDQSGSEYKDHIRMIRNFGTGSLALNRPSSPRTNEVKDWLFPKFVLRRYAESATYLVNDSIVLKVKVDVQV